MALLELDDVRRTFRQRGRVVTAIDGVSFALEPGEALGLIGESGCGKSTLARVALGLFRPDSGDVRFEGISLAGLAPGELRALRARLQIVFQEPYESLNPRMTVGAIVSEPLAIHRPELSNAERQVLVEKMLEQVGLNAGLMTRRPRALSGGQQQRIGIARAMVTHPRLVVLDEPTSSLDLSVRARILTLLADLRESLGLTYLFISHDVSTVRHFCSRVAVMYRGRIVEEGRTQEVLNAPRHPYTVALLSAELSVDPAQRRTYVPLRPAAPLALARPGQCPLLARCPVEMPECAAAEVQLTDIGGGRRVACIRAVRGD